METSRITELSCEEMKENPDHQRHRSEFTRQLVQRTDQGVLSHRMKGCSPRTLFQFWHNLSELPEDVHDCIKSWSQWTNSGFVHRLFDEASAKAFIRASFDGRHVRAFEKCYHPAMQADYFRLCYLFTEGGCYIDADDVCLSGDIGGLFDDARLKVQPLCYDNALLAMVPPHAFLQVDAYSQSWIFYFNNTPLIADRGHPIIERALRDATDNLDYADDDVLPEIQATAGPGNLTEAIFAYGLASGDIENQLVVLRDWDSLAISKWPLSYRDDSRNWRHSNQQRFRPDNNQA